MFSKRNVKTAFLGISLAIMTAFGTYSFMPAPQPAYAKSCDGDEIVRRILYCLDRAEISHGKFYPYCTS